MQEHFSQTGWSKGATIYEVNLRQYTREGSFRAFANHLPRLKKMGVDILWFMPITPISLEKRQGTLGSYYACSSYVQTNPEFGSIDDFKNLVDAAHQLRLKVIIDWVANHTGWDHEWVKKKPGYYLKDAAGNFTEKNGWEDVIGLDYENRELHKAMVHAMQFWIETCSIDGFRCDMAHLVPLEFWKEARKACDQLKPLYWLGECEEEHYFEVFDTVYGWRWMHLSEAIAKRKSNISNLKNLLVHYTAHNGRYLLFTSNHDENSWNGTDVEKYGNALKAFAVLAATWPGMFLLYSGQEIPLQHRLKFFEKDEIPWKKKLALEAFYTLLIALRKQTTCMQPGTKIFYPETTNEENIFSFHLEHHNQEILVILNLSPENQINFSCKEKSVEGTYTEYFSKTIATISPEKIFCLDAWAYAVYIKN